MESIGERPVTAGKEHELERKGGGDPRGGGSGSLVGLGWVLRRRECYTRGHRRCRLAMYKGRQRSWARASMRLCFCVCVFLSVRIMFWDVRFTGKGPAWLRDAGSHVHDDLVRPRRTIG